MSLVGPVENIGKLVQEVPPTKDLEVVSIDNGRGKCFRATFKFAVSHFRLVPAHTNWLSSDDPTEMLAGDETVMELYGLASSTGSDAFNLQLSEKRLFAVFNELIRQGASPSAIKKRTKELAALGEVFAKKQEGDNVEDAAMRATILYLWVDEVSRHVTFSDDPILKEIRKNDPNF